MPPKKNALKLNKLQLRTLALLQVLATDEQAAKSVDAETGDVTLTSLPRPHGDHVHIGAFSVSARDASGLANPAVWKALERKQLAQEKPGFGYVIRKSGLDYDTGLSDKFVNLSDH